MQTARVTVLMTPEKKAAMEAVASNLGVSTGEYIRLAVDNYRVPEEKDELLAALVDQLAETLPAMQADLDAMGASMTTARTAIDKALRATGARK